MKQGSTEVSIRPIRPADDPQVQEIVCGTLGEFGCTGEGFAAADPEVEAMSAAYPGGDARFFVLARGDEVVGCGGFSRLAGSDPEAAICELQKMYFRPEVRGQGLGRRFLAFLLAEMRDGGYRRSYLETTTQMHAAQHLYRAFGFRPVPHAMGATGHHGCDRFYLLDLS